MPWGSSSNKMMRIYLYLGVFYWILPIFFTGVSLQIAFNSIVFGIATALLFTWGPSMYYALRGDTTAENQQIVATVTMWLIVWLQRLYSIIYVAMDRPEWLQKSVVPAFLAYMFGATGVILLIAPSFVKGVSVREYYWQMGIAVACGVVFGMTSYYLQIVGLDQ